MQLSEVDSIQDLIYVYLKKKRFAEVFLFQTQNPQSSWAYQNMAK